MNWNTEDMRYLKLDFFSGSQQEAVAASGRKEKPQGTISLGLPEQKKGQTTIRNLAPFALSL